MNTVLKRIPAGRVLRKGPPEQEQEEHVVEVASQWRLMWWKFKKHKVAVFSGFVLIFLYLCAAFCGFISPAVPNQRWDQYVNLPPQAIHFEDKNGFHLQPFVYGVKQKIDPMTFNRIYVADKSQEYPIELFAKGPEYKLWGVFPTNIHLFGTSNPNAPLFIMGTDSLGRDLFTRVLYGSLVSLSFGLVGIVLTFVLGLVIGGISGYFGGVVDTIIQRTIDLLICIPTIPLWMALAAALPRTWSALQIYFGMVFILSLIGWTGLARVVRGWILALREEDFTVAARLAGASNLRIIAKHLLPSFASYIIVNITLSIPGTILGETSLSFLGLGLQPPVVSWGVLLQDAQNVETLAFHPWLLWPTAFIIVTVLMFNFLGDGLRDAADPYKS